MTRRVAAILTALLVLAPVSGCGSSDEGPKVDKASKTDRLGTKVDLLEAGDAPRRKVRFALHAGDKGHRTMTMDMTMAMGVDGAPGQSVRVPAMNLGVALDVTDLDDDGIATSTFRYDDVFVDGTGAAARELEKKLDAVVGVRGTIRSTTRGAVLDSDVTIPDDLDPTMKATMESFESQMSNLAVPFPVEAIGTGARWKVRTHLEVNGIRTDATYVYRLVSRDGDRLVLATEIEQTAPEQDPDLPGLPPGATHVKEMGGSGSGRIVVDLSSQLPLTMATSSTMHAEFSIEQGGRSQELVQDMNVVVKLDSKRRAGAPA